jgi:hypothetical protein
VRSFTVGGCHAGWAGLAASGSGGDLFQSDGFGQDDDLFGGFLHGAPLWLGLVDSVSEAMLRQIKQPSCRLFDNSETGAAMEL